jgi:hypothetical protein
MSRRRRAPDFQSSRWLERRRLVLTLLAPVVMNQRRLGQTALVVPFLGLLWLVAGSSFGCGNTKAVGGGPGGQAGSVPGSGGGAGGSPVTVVDAALPDATPPDAAPPDAAPPDAAADLVPASCAPNQVVEPVSTIGGYQERTCLGSTAEAACTVPSLMQRLLACDAVSFTSQPQNSLVVDILRVSERREHTCVIEMWEDFEANESYWTCELPLPLAPWLGLLTKHGIYSQGALLDGIRDHCKVATCCTFVPFCSPMHCDPGYKMFGC